MPDHRNMSLCQIMLATLVTSLFALSTSSALAADNYPNRVIRLIVPFAPGGVTDVSGRVVAEGLSKVLGQQVIVENRPGASGNIGAATVATATPDGYTLLLALDGTLVINPYIYEKPGFNALKDFMPVAKIGNSTIVMVTNPNTGILTLQDLIETSKKTPGGLSYGTSGIGSITHIAGELLNQQTGAGLTHVPYKGGAPAVNDVLGGHIPLTFGSAASVQQHLQGKVLIPIAVPSPARSPALPDVPTFRESGVPDVALNSWVGIVAPTNTPVEIINQLNAATNRVLSDPIVQERLLAAGISTVNETPEQFGQTIIDDASLYKQIIEQADIKVQ